MTPFATIALLVTLAALFSYVNHRALRLPHTIGVMLLALLVSLGLIAVDTLGSDLYERARAILETIDFDEVVLHGLLAFLLFAGALHVDLNDLAAERWPIAALATAGVLLSTVIVGALMWGVFGLLALEVSPLYCLLFGALISPTDPIAVLGILRSAGAPKRLETKITGESLFNDGIGVVVFLVLLGLATGQAELSTGYVAELFFREAFGGGVLGIGAGLVAYAMLRSVDEYQVEILGTLALAMGTYAIAEALHLSAPIAVVVAGLLIGNHGRRLAMSERTRQHLDTFWELVDVILNAVLFLLIGLEVLVLALTPDRVAAAVLAIPVVLLARVMSVGSAIKVLERHMPFAPHTIRILTWAGLRGGISVALALALPRGPEREVVLTATYGVVLFSIVVQGLSVGWLIRRSGHGIAV
jgi:CPA1 family monovalent cation:H+ antiporter